MFKLGNTPVVLRELGAKNLPVMMTQDVISKVNGETHEIALNDIRKLPQAITDPIMVFKSATVPNSFVIFTELTDMNNDDIVVALHLSRFEKHIKINRISSIYGKEHSKNFVKKQLELGNLKYYDKNKILSWSQSRGLQLPKLADTIKGSNNIILEKEDIVKKYFKQNAETLLQKNSSKKKIAFEDIANSYYINNFDYGTSEAYIKNPAHIINGGKSYTDFLLGENTDIYQDEIYYLINVNDVVAVI